MNDDPPPAHCAGQATSAENVNGVLVPLAAELVATVRDYGMADVAAVLGRIPDRPAMFDGRDALLVILAAMVDPDASPSQLLAWTEQPVASRGFTPQQYAKPIPGEAWGRMRERRQEIGRLSGLGLTAQEISERMGVTRRTVVRHRAAIRGALEMAS